MRTVIVFSVIAVAVSVCDAQWVQTSLDNVNVYCFAINGTYLYAGTESGGVFLSTNNGTSWTVVNSGLTDASPTQFVVNQNYPNPFNPTTTIRYGLPHKTFVTLAVYDTLGQQVAQIVNEQQQAGYHETVFRGDGLASGVYFYRLQLGNFAATRKVILVR
jgi:hypothetical protein